MAWKPPPSGYVVVIHVKAQLSAARSKQERAKLRRKQQIMTLSKVEDEEGQPCRRMPDGQILPEE